MRTIKILNKKSDSYGVLKYKFLNKEFFIGLNSNSLQVYDMETRIVNITNLTYQKDFEDFFKEINIMLTGVSSPTYKIFADKHPELI